ncbi:MAG: copper homeostasis protein CutC [Allomuricauda sp.]|nr:MAG: copper homeostasis protein CutC [Allomuricauda sp.]
MLIEVCVNSLQSAINAQQAGADRIELCSELGVGGITPSYGLIRMVREALTIPIHVLVRPRGGHFTYSETEFEVMLEDVRQCHALGVDGIVSGILHEDATLDATRTQKLIATAMPLHFTFHRAFDWIPNPEATLEQLEHFNVNTVLTSGQQQHAEMGLKNLEQWQGNTKMTIMAGSGVTPVNVLKFKKVGLRAAHLSGTRFENEVSTDHKIPMTSEKHLQEHRVAVTNEEIIRQTVRAVK